MPIYAYQCTNLACNHAFEVAQPMATAGDTAIFCPLCHSVAHQDVATQAKSVTIQPRQHQDAKELQPLQALDEHGHAPNCTCALHHNWRQVAQTLDQDQQTAVH
jgi:putative FmdB family regulatory protein